MFGPITGSFGADVHGLDLSQPLDGATTTAVEAAFAEHMVLAFRGQELTVEQLEAFALQFGTFGDTPFITPVDGHPNVLAVIREADEAGALFGGSWHSDWSFQSATTISDDLVRPRGPARWRRHRIHESVLGL